MRFRRKATVTDLEAFRRGAAANGAYDDSSEGRRRALIETALTHPDPDVAGRAVSKLTAQIMGPYLSNPSPTSSAVGEHRAPLSTVCSEPLASFPGSEHFPHSVDGGAPSTSIAEVCEQLDILREDNAALQRENTRLRSELNQALAQLRIARGQRDEFRAQLDWANNK